MMNAKQEVRWFVSGRGHQTLNTSRTFNTHSTDCRRSRLAFLTHRTKNQTPIHPSLACGGKQKH